MNDNKILMNESPIVSIVIPLYNKVPYIARTIDSILKQTFTDFEIIVVGGKSNDGSENIVKSYSDSRIRIITETGTGVSSARNQGINAAKSELIAFIDADDEWKPEFLETIISLRKDYPNMGLYGTGYGYKFRKKMRMPDTFGLSRDFRGVVSYFKMWEIFGTSAMAIPKEVLLNVGLFNPSSFFGEDMELLSKIALRYQMAIDLKILSIYHQDDNNSACHVYSRRPIEHFPFSEYFLSHSSELESLGNYEDILLYVEQEELMIFKSNLHSGKFDFASNNLKNIHSPQVISKLGLIMYNIIINLPFKLGQYWIIQRMFEAPDYIIRKYIKKR